MTSGPEPLRLWDRAAEAPAVWEEAQDRLADEAIRVALERSREARVRLNRSGINEAVTNGCAGLSSIPVLSKDDLPALQAADPPFGGMLGVPVDELRRIYRSPGPIHDPEGHQLDYWRMAPALWAAGFRSGDIALNTFSYHLTPGGAMMDSGLRAVGCVVLSGGVGQTMAQAELSCASGATGFVGTPQFLLTLLERAEEEGVTHSLRRALTSGGPLMPALRERLITSFRVRAFQVYGTADVGAIAYECEEQVGWHIAPGVVVEVLDPASGAPCAPGDTGEVVVTAPNPVYPLLRLGTGDLSSFVAGECSCGRTSMRLAGFLGRVGDGVKVRGMFVHPGTLASALRDQPIGCWQGVVTEENHRDVFTLRVEAGPDGDPCDGEASVPLDLDTIGASVRRVTGLRASVNIVPKGSIGSDAPPILDGRGV